MAVSTAKTSIHSFGLFSGQSCEIRFRQGFSGEAPYPDEIDLSVFGLPLSLLSTNVRDQVSS